MDLTNFLLSVLSSVIGSIIFLVAVSFFSRKVRWVLTATLGRILNIDTEYVFKNSSQANEEISHELKRAKIVRILAGRGNSLQRPPYDMLFTQQNLKGKLQILLPTIQPTGPINWIEQREAEIFQFDSSIGPGLLRHQIETNIKFLEPSVQRHQLELQFYDGPHFAKIVITNNCAFFTPYTSSTHGREDHVIKYRAGGDMYNWLNRIFDQYWQIIHPN